MSCPSRRAFLATGAAAPFLPRAAVGGIEPGGSPFLEEMTSPELERRIEAGARIALVPTGGTEQNGPHMALGKHQAIVGHAAAAVARALGDAVVAPVIAYVPEGPVEKTGHMAFPGTLTLPEGIFEKVVEYAARSLALHGFRLICLIGDHGASQKPQERVAARLTAEWRRSGIRTLHVADYYDRNGQEEWLKSQGFPPATQGVHAGLTDTAELMAAAPGGVRSVAVEPYTGKGLGPAGINGDPRLATTEIGRRLIALKVDAAVRQIRAAADEMKLS
jgi:creatinine amidohydrolase/Fe(II)-dependent formamide hydrolase-like protein